MVFSSNPLYLDPHNWQQQQQLPGGGEIENNQLSLPVPLPPPPINRESGFTTTATTSTGTGPIRPGSMAERARQAKIPQPEAALKCPRCESTNTKFCYFNNYNLSQPRHFCKTCRRYWTRGGSLRNVPVGGGCRRNKRSKKSSRSKSPVPLERPTGSCSTTHDMIGHFLPPPTQLPLLPTLPHLSDYSGNEIGLNFTRISGGNIIENNMGFKIGNTSGGEQWRLQNFPFISGLETPSAIYPFEGGSVNSQGGYTVAAPGHELGSKALDSGVNEVASVKIEENQGVNMSRNFLGIMGNDQYWGGNSIGNAWTDLSGFTSTSSTSHLL